MDSRTMSQDQQQQQQRRGIRGARRREQRPRRRPGGGKNVLLMIGLAAATTASLPSVVRGGFEVSYGSSNCNLQCKHQDAKCELGEKTYDQTHYDDLGGLETNRDNMHCTCPDGYTGVLCEIKVDSCSDSVHRCYHGGRCIPGLIDEYDNEQHFCDCSTASDADGNQFAGKYCEHAVMEYCDGDPKRYCLNGGQCNEYYGETEQDESCLCRPDFDGPHCEYKADSVPDCELDCQNGGTCVLGGPELGGNDGEEGDHYHPYFQNTDEAAEARERQRHARCECPDAYDGALCEVPKAPCGEGHCFHGAECLTRVVDGQELHHCDCSSADTEDASYAGRFCQYEATAYCTKQGSLNGQLFCVNGGQCRQDAYEGCDCDDGFTGFSCQFVTTESAFDDQARQRDFENGVDTQAADYENDSLPAIVDTEESMSCDLDCQNGGTCRIGIKTVAYLGGAGAAPHLNQTHDGNYQHCVCDDEFVGVYCEHQIEECPDGYHMCLHGGKCVPDYDPGHKYTCDCDDASSEALGNPAAFAGEHCEHPSTSICTKDEDTPGRPLSFCTNGGTCKGTVSAGEPHPGCDCQDGWTGPHCEMRDPGEDEELSASLNGEGGYDDDDGKDLFAIFAYIVGSLGIVVVALFLWRQRSQNQRRKNHFVHDNLMISSSSLRWNGSGAQYRDEPLNIAPRRQSEAVDVDDTVYNAAIAGTSSAATPAVKTSSSRSLAGRTDMRREFVAAVTSTSSSNRGGVGATDENDSSDEGSAGGSPSGGRVAAPPAANDQPQIYFGPPRDEDGHELHNVEIC